MAQRDNTPTRLVLCVDGTSKSNFSQTNIHRIFAGAGSGKCQDSRTSFTFNQVLKYIPGIGSADDVFSKERLQASVLRHGHLSQIQDVYESCCQLTGAQDEIWLFGFSRGAYIVRAVAGLLHNFGALTTAGHPEFSKNFRKLLKEAELTEGKSSITLSPISSRSMRAAPKIKFVGVFDTIKAVSDDSSFDISFNGSIQHMRHALALHEGRKSLTPEYFFPEQLCHNNLRETGRSCVQAWFVGTHADMGGSTKDAGLGLYPLQWMLLEAIDRGLSLEPRGSLGYVLANPPSVALPRVEDKIVSGQWTCTTANGIVVEMRDLRNLHSQHHQKKSYAVKLNSRLGSIRQKRVRETFTDNGVLCGYCDWAPQGTILHPSIYFLLDEHINVSLETKELRLQRHIEDWRERMLGSQNGVVNAGFWLTEDENDAPDPGAVRILVCGNTGVGKSTLINKTFGVDVTQSSNRTRGIHDVRQEITFEGRPDLVVHDSGGFEAGADDEFQAVQEFLKEKSAAVDVADRLHVIWFCVDINSPRALQTATEKLFQAVSLYANDVPIVVVATKKDDFLDIEFGTHRKALKKQGMRFDEDACERYAEERLKDQVEMLRNEMESVQDGRLDACVAVSQDDDDSIAHLSKMTARCFDTDKVRLLYIRAQVTRIDLKIDLALCEVARRYKRLVAHATGASLAPLGASINRKVSTTAITKSIINCFGLPTVSADAALAALNAHVWKTFGTNMSMVLAESMHLLAVAASACVGGIPIFLVTGGINATYVVPVTCRLFLIVACDLIFVLARSFKEVTFRASGQPTQKDVNTAARNYSIRGYSQHVHREVKKLVPRRNIIKSYKTVDIQKGLDYIFSKYKDKLMEDVDLPLKAGKLKLESELEDDDTSTEADSTLFMDLKEAKLALAELDDKQTPIELDAGQSLTELPGYERPKVSELAHSYSTVRKPAELQG